MCCSVCPWWLDHKGTVGFESQATCAGPGMSSAACQALWSTMLKLRVLAGGRDCEVLGHWALFMMVPETLVSGISAKIFSLILCFFVSPLQTDMKDSQLTRKFHIYKPVRLFSCPKSPHSFLSMFSFLSCKNEVLLFYNLMSESSFIQLHSLILSSMKQHGGLGFLGTNLPGKKAPT